MFKNDVVLNKVNSKRFLNFEIYIIFHSKNLFKYFVLFFIKLPL